MLHYGKACSILKHMETNQPKTGRINFYQLTMNTWVAKAQILACEHMSGYVLVATFEQLDDTLDGERFRVIYYTGDAGPKRTKTTRTVTANIDTVQKRILDRGVC